MKPCRSCPFLKPAPEHEGADESPVRLSRARRREIAAALRRGGSFPCHKTVQYGDDDGDGRTTAKSIFCGGALATMDNDGMDKQGSGCMANQSVRIWARLNLKHCDVDNIEGREDCYPSLRKWVDEAPTI